MTDKKDFYNKLRSSPYQFDYLLGKVPAHRHKNPDGTIGGWVAETATVDDTCYIDKDAQVFDYACVHDRAQILDEARVFEFSTIKDDAVVADVSHVCGDAVIGGSVYIGGSSFFTDSKLIDSGVYIE